MFFLFLSELLEEFLNPISWRTSTSALDNTEAPGILYPVGCQHNNMHLTRFYNTFPEKAYWKGPCEGWACRIQDGIGPTGKHRIPKTPSPFTSVTRAQPGFSQCILFLDQLWSYQPPQCIKDLGLCPWSHVRKQKKIRVNLRKRSVFRGPD